MQMALRDLLAATQAMSRLGEQKVPVAISFELAKLENVLKKLSRKGETERLKRSRIIRAKYTGKDDQDSRDQAGDEMTAIMDELIDMPPLDKIKLPEQVKVVCEKCHDYTARDLEVEPHVLAALERFIKE